MNLFKWRKVMFLGKETPEVRIALIEQFHQLKNIESEANVLKNIFIEAKKHPESPTLPTHYVQASDALRKHIVVSNSYCKKTRVSPMSVSSITNIDTDKVEKDVRNRLKTCESNLAALR